jgi:hypothetical protein
MVEKAVPGAAVQINAQDGGILRGHSLSKEAPYQAGKHISHAAAGHAGVAAGVDPHSSVGEGGHRPGPLEDENNPEPCGKLTGGAHPVALHLPNRAADQAGHFPWMGRQDSGRAGAFEKDRWVGSQGVEPVGIENEGQGALPHQATKQVGRPGVLSQTGAEGQGVLARPEAGDFLMGQGAQNPFVPGPVPALMPPSAVMAAAPVLPREPARTSRCPKVPLCPVGGRSGSSPEASAASTS